MATPEDLLRLLLAPNETLSVEYKSWLDLNANEGKATLAKAAIALANHGGGIVVLGLRPDGVRKGSLVPEPFPPEIRRYTQDDINAAINRYADPAIHCELQFARHPHSQTDHAFVMIPGGSTVPIMSSRDCINVISKNRCYIRKPGPRSEDPFTSEEWRALLDRCVRAGRDELLDAIRHIVLGHAGTPPPADALARLREFSRTGFDRWQSLLTSLPPNDPARMQHGYRELTFEIRGVPAAASLMELRSRLDQAERIKLTGWHPFLSLSREPFMPRVVDGVIETWLGPDDDIRTTRSPAHCDFWRASLEGRLYMVRGFEEDNSERFVPGTSFDVSLPIWRVAEPLLHVARLARLFGDEPTIAFKCRYVGLSNRQLTSLDGRRFVYAQGRAIDNEVENSLTAAVADIENNLAELLLTLLRPLYERFNFFELTMDLVIDELNRLRRGRS